MIFIEQKFIFFFFAVNNKQQQHCRAMWTGFYFSIAFYFIFRLITFFLKHWWKEKKMSPITNRGIQSKLKQWELTNKDTQVKQWEICFSFSPYKIEEPEIDKDIKRRTSFQIARMHFCWDLSRLHLTSLNCSQHDVILISSRFSWCIFLTFTVFYFFFFFNASRFFCFFCLWKIFFFS